MAKSSVTIRLKEFSEQTINPNIRRIIGLLPARFIVGIIDELDLEANPRNSRLGSVTSGIIDSIRQDEDSSARLFPFKTKGILLAASSYVELDRKRFELTFEDRHTEGILDGGHNTLAIGVYILTQAKKAAGKPSPKKKDIQIWENFKQTWNDSRADIESYIEKLREKKEREELAKDGISQLDFLVPLELLLPTDQDNELCVEGFRKSLLEICDARNNNAQLTQGTKANQEGLFDTMRALFEEKDPEFAEQISWKTNDGNRIDSRSLVALSWISLSLTHWVNSGEKLLEAPSAVSIYSGKEKCLERYLDLMRHDEITKACGSSRRELYDPCVLSALKTAVDLPWLYDAIYRMFPSRYNKIGSYGRISAVKGLMNKRNEYATPFLNQPADQPVPDGFIYPLIYGLRAIMRVNSENGRVEWATNPYTFIESSAFANAVVQYCGVIQQSDYDPQKVGKGAFSYTSAENAIKLAYMS